MSPVSSDCACTTKLNETDIFCGMSVGVRGGRRRDDEVVEKREQEGLVGGGGVGGTFESVE